MGLDLKFIHNNIARILHDILNNYYGLEINLKDICVNVMYRNAQVLDEELNLLFLGFF